MDTNKALRIVLAALAAGSCAGQEPITQDTLANRILRMSEGEQIAYTTDFLNRGMPIDQSGPFGMLLLNRSSLVLPMVETKIEEVLRSSSPSDCFTDKTVNPQKFVDLAAWSIPGSGDEYALREISKLMAIDESRFGMLVRNTLLAAQNIRNPFSVAYRGFKIHDPSVDKRIIEWAGHQFDAKSEHWLRQLNQWWGVAIADYYGAAPTESNWLDDPIASKLKPELANSLRPEILRLAREAHNTRPKK